jgi:3-phenylpropionate/cinnamic acid dioxygenase small subunit
VTECSGPDRVLTRGLPASPDPQGNAAAAAFLAFEARLLDERRFDEWLALFTQDCLYWIPTDAEALPDAQVAVAYEDHRRLTDRVTWLKSAFLHAQSPPSRTVRQITNVECWPDGDLTVVKSAVTLHELRGDRLRSWVGHMEHHLTPDARIRRKTVLLINYDKPLGNIAFAF